jgi:hypothetical protein
MGKSRFRLYALALARRSLITADEYQARFAADRIVRNLEKRQIHRDETVPVCGGAALGSGFET